jgi:putative alpha-1,2-mannosidase
MSRLLAGLLIATDLLAAHRDPLAHVNPLIGTQRSRIGYGGTMPFVSPPFAMTNWTPQTRQNKISITSYGYDDTAITGFIGTHQPAIWMGDYGYITLMPQIGEKSGGFRTTPEARQLAFSHHDEIAHPDYYAVTLRTAEGARIRAEMTATERCAFFRFRFPGAGVARVLVETSRPGIPGFAAVDPETHEITGYNPHRMDAHLGP